MSDSYVSYLGKFVANIISLIQSGIQSGGRNLERVHSELRFVETFLNAFSKRCKFPAWSLGMDRSRSKDRKMGKFKYFNPILMNAAHNHISTAIEQLITT